VQAHKQKTNQYDQQIDILQAQADKSATLETKMTDYRSKVESLKEQIQINNE
jgi:hypothetical protein